jgi:epoxyqueuosine reductase
MGNHIFGCDLCQDVCPYNTRVRVSGEPGCFPREGLFAPELVPLLALSEAEFRTRFAGTPILRAKRRGLLRNVCVALGNLGRPEAVPALTRVLREEAEALVRSHAAWALGRIRDAGARAALVQAQALERDPAVAEEIRLALADHESASVRGKD